MDFMYKYVDMYSDIYLGYMWDIDWVDWSQMVMWLLKG